MMIYCHDKHKLFIFLKDDYDSANLEWENVKKNHIYRVFLGGDEKSMLL
jgi:hypothetical protein